MKISKETILSLQQELLSSTSDAQLFINDFVNSKTKDLDKLMQEIKKEIVDNDTIDDNLLEHYFLELTNTLYFLNAQSEETAFYDDMSKVNFKLAYNQAYANNQVNNLGNTKKTTVADNQLAGENGSINEQVLNLIYSRATKIIKAKVDAGYEMVRTLSKIISSRQQDKQLSLLKGSNL